MRHSQKEREAADKIRSDSDARREHAAMSAAAEAVRDRHSPWKPSEKRDAQDPALAAFLRKVKNHKFYARHDRQRPYDVQSHSLQMLLEQHTARLSTTRCNLSGGLLGCFAESNECQSNTMTCMSSSFSLILASLNIADCYRLLSSQRLSAGCHQWRSVRGYVQY